MSHHDHDSEYYEMVHKDYGHGARSKVSIVKRKSDGKLLIWKQPLLDDLWHHESLEKEFKYTEYWRKFGVSKVKVSWHPDKRSLLKTYIKGCTLGQMLEQNLVCFSQKSKPLKALRKFIERLITSRHYIGDVIEENIVFDGEDWHIIDSGSIKKKKSRSDTKKAYKKRFLENWSKKLSSQDEINSLELFINSIESK